MNSLRSHIKNLKECFTRYTNTSKSVKKLSCASFFQPTSWCMDTLMKHSFSCLILHHLEQVYIVIQLMAWTCTFFFNACFHLLSNLVTPPRDSHVEGIITANCNQHQTLLFHLLRRIPHSPPPPPSPLEHQQFRS